MPEIAEAPVEATENKTTEIQPGNPGSVKVELFANRKPKETPKEETKGEAASEQKKPEDGVIPAQDKPKETPKKNDAETNLAAMRKKLEETEAAAKTAAEERDRLRTEYETFKTKPVELPDDVKSKLTAVEKYEKELAETRAALRQADLSRDPEFRARYQSAIENRIGIMGKVALAAGVTEAQWKSAVASWNKDQFGEWAEAMSPGQRMEFQAAWQKAEDLYIEQQEQLQNADRTYAEIEKTRKEQAEAQQREHFSANERLARESIKEVLARPGAEDFPDLKDSADAMLMRAARYELSPKEVFDQIAANQVLARVTQKQDATIKELRSQIEAHEKKIKEQDEFIAMHGASTPRGDAAGNAGNGNEPYVPPWKRVVIKP